MDCNMAVGWDLFILWLWLYYLKPLIQTPSNRYSQMQYNMAKN